MGKLKQSAMTGCHFCAVLYHLLVRPPSSWNVPPVKSNTALEYPIVLEIWRFGIETRLDQSRPPNEAVRVYHGQQTAQLEFIPAISDMFARMSLEVSRLWEDGNLLASDSSTGSDANMEMAKEWYLRCRREHEICHSDTSPLPTRVIDISDVNEGKDPTLYQPPPGTFGEYIALSHCWGATKPLEPTGPAGNVRQALPPLLKWPKTFRDAVHVAKALGIHYLWIDSMCILQHDASDWAAESSRMSDYFGNAAITIAALGAADGTQGCFWPRNPLLTRPCRAVFRFGDHHHGSEDSPEHCFMVATPPLSADEWEEFKAPLQSRVWVLQEEILARRILRFGKQQLYWNCLVHVASESFPDGKVNTDRSKLRKRLHKGPLRVHPPGTRNPFYDDWYNIIKNVNRRNMTYNKDILPAISAIAKSIHPLMDFGDNYLAGLWEKDLKVGLLWVVPRGRAKARSEPTRPPLPVGRPNYICEGFTAPSWSWISMSHQEIITYQFEKPRRNDNATAPYASCETLILSAEIELKDIVAPYGEVVRGTLRFRAQVCPITIEKWLSPQKARRASLQSLQVSPFTWKVQTSAVSHFSFISPYRLNLRVVTGDCELDNAESAARPWWSFFSFRGQDHYMQATFLPLLFHDAENSGYPKRYMGLALVPTDGGNEFRRIGRVSLDVDAITYAASRLPYRDITVV